MARPKGSKNKWKPDLLVRNKEPLQRKAVEMALNGNETCMRICMDRLYPRLRNVAAPVNVETASDDLAAQGSAIIAATLAGRLTPDVLRDLMSAFSDQARLIDFAEFERRLQKVESSADRPPWEARAKKRELLPIRGKRRRTKT
jgi:hypothetical protein